ncbi:hypothetical protein [Aeromicrobium sp. IC_218]|uniref:hypothetical protein n=1 Tax=Aeromicrobium sp. IC_218 TaxID=2545468 RepID=UPI001038DDDE|nr:hypothetical protein [Aeromicrobium sp. IC_218]TCI99356.1 hypothetical protein E0W78_06365 [Aeromicrobium sp. IC_218]
MSADWNGRLGPGYWAQAPVAALLAAGLFWLGAQAPGGWRPVLLLAGSVLALYAAYVLLMPLVVRIVVAALEALSEDAKGPATGRPTTSTRQRRGLPPAPRGARHWVDAGSSRLVRRRLLVDDRGRVLHEDDHDRRADLALGAGLVLALAVSVLSAGLDGGAGGVVFALAVMTACGVLGMAAVRVAGRVAVSRLGS